MKKLSAIMAILFCISSLVCADIISDLQAKKEKFHNQGISYVAEVYEDDETTITKYLITEKGNNKSFETVGQSFSMPGMLYCDDGKVYSVPPVESQDPHSPIMITIIPQEQIGINPEKYKMPSYVGFVASKKETVNGYQCQLLVKIDKRTEKNTENGEKFAYYEYHTNTTKIWVIEKYGYPTKIEQQYDLTYSNGGNSYTEKKKPINFTNYSTDISKRTISLPKYAFIIDPKDPSSTDPKKLMELRMKIAEEEEEEED